MRAYRKACEINLAYRIPTVPGVIEARSTTYTIYQEIAATNPESDLERSNASHKHFLDCLTEAFEALGGNAWMSSQQAEEMAAQGTNDVEEILFDNKFASLGLDSQEGGGERDEEEELSDRGEDPELQPTTTFGRPQQKRSSGKGKKGRRGQRAKKNKKKQKPDAVEEGGTEDIPLESYRIIEDEDGLVTEYLMAVYALFREWIDVRAHIQRVWRNVACSGLNSAVAGAVSNMAVMMIKRT